MSPSASTNRPGAAIRLVNVQKHFGGITVAQDISLEIHRGEILGLIGPNGAGKTTLFNLISGIHAPDRGEIYLGERPLSRLPVYKRARLGIARTWQHVRLFPTLSVLDNLLLGPRDYPGAGTRDRASAILARVGMSEARDKMPGALPFGQQKLVALARTLMNDGEVLLLDEPMAGVEGQVYETIKQVVRDEAKAGRAVCVVEHNVSFIRDLCTRAVFMFNGRIEQQGTVEELLASEKLAELYFGGKEVSLRLENVSARYGKLVALTEVSLEVPAGARVAVFGHNGAGKTTLLKCAVGALPDMQGEVRFGGERVEPGAVYRNTRHGIGFVPQGHNVFKSLDVQRNLTIAGLLHDAGYVDQVYALFPILKERRAQLAGSLSGGQQQMLALGMALMTQPKVLLLDEPMSGLAPVIVENVFESLVKINRSTGAAIVIVEQNVKATLPAVERAVILRAGRLVWDGSSAELAQKEDLWAWF